MGMSSWTSEGGRARVSGDRSHGSTIQRVQGTVATGTGRFYVDPSALKYHVVQFQRVEDVTLHDAVSRLGVTVHGTSPVPTYRFNQVSKHIVQKRLPVTRILSADSCSGVLIRRESATSRVAQQWTEAKKKPFSLGHLLQIVHDPLVGNTVLLNNIVYAWCMADEGVALVSLLRNRQLGWGLGFPNPAPVFRDTSPYHSFLLPNNGFGTFVW